MLDSIQSGIAVKPAIKQYLIVLVFSSLKIPRIFLVPREEIDIFPRSSRGIKNRGKSQA